MSEEALIEWLLQDIMNYYDLEGNGEWDDPTGEKAVRLAENTPPNIEGGDAYA